MRFVRLSLHVRDQARKMHAQLTPRRPAIAFRGDLISREDVTQPAFSRKPQSLPRSEFRGVRLAKGVH